MNKDTNAPLSNGSQKAALNGTRLHDVFPLLVGTFRSPTIYTLALKPTAASSSSSSSVGTDTSSIPPSTLSVSHKSTAVGGHSWLALSPSKTHLYTTCWTSPPSVAAYSVNPTDHSVTLLNTAPVASLSGYVAVTPSGRHLISVGGPTGEVFRLLLPDDKVGDGNGDGDGRIGPLTQTLSFRNEGGADDGKRDGVAHGGFGGLRWGAHSVDISPDGKAAYVADIGHNCIWTYHLHEPRPETETGTTGAGTGKEGGPPLLTLGSKHISVRGHDGPRHAWPHPNGTVLYVVQEHSSMVDAFAVARDGVTLTHLHGYTIIPEAKKCGDFWADEVRTSHFFSWGTTTGTDKTEGVAARKPRYLYASTRGLQPETKGYVAAYELDEAGRITGPALEIYETRTSGGLANAIEPAPREVSSRSGVGEELIALTDSEEGWVVILGWNGKRFREVAANKLEAEDGQVVQAATAVWL